MIINLKPKDKLEAVRSHLGNEGRLLSASKSMYLEKFPSHKTFFNACLFDSSFTQLWFGDIDFDADSESLQLLSNYINEVIFITREQPYRWDGLKDEQVDGNKDVVIVKPSDAVHTKVEGDKDE